MLRWCWGSSKWLQLKRKEKKDVGIECHAGHLKVARKWREGNWHKPTRFPYFGTQAHALAPLALVVSPVLCTPYTVGRQEYHPLFPVSCPARPCLLSRAVLSCARLQGERVRERDSSIDRSPKQLTGALASRSLLALQVYKQQPTCNCVLGRIEPTAVETNPSGLQPSPTSHPPNLQLASRSSPAGRPPWLETPGLPAFLLARPCLDGATGQRSHRRETALA